MFVGVASASIFGAIGAVATVANENIVTGDDSRPPLVLQVVLSDEPAILRLFLASTKERFEESHVQVSLYVSFLPRETVHPNGKPVNFFEKYRDRIDL